MALQILLMLTILSAIGEFKGVQCTNDISDEFNLQCYVSMYAYILNIINNGPAALLPTNITVDIRNSLQLIEFLNISLHRLDDWNKYLEDSSPSTIWNHFTVVKTFVKNPYHTSVLMQRYAMEMVFGSNLKQDEINGLQTLKGIRFFQILKSANNEDIQIIVEWTFQVCISIFKTLTNHTSLFENSLINTLQSNAMLNLNLLPFTTTYGYLMLLMTKKEFDSSLQQQTNIQKAFLVVIVESALQDIYLFMLDILNRTGRYSVVSNVTNIARRVLKRMLTVFHNIVDLSELLHNIYRINNVIGETFAVKSNIGLMITYDYRRFIAEFKKKWWSKIIEGQDSSSLYTIAQHYHGRLIYSGRFMQPLLGYYVSNEEIYVNYNDPAYLEICNTDDKLILLMELNAWTIVLHQQSTVLKDSLEIRGSSGQPSEVPNFQEDKDFIEQFKNLLQ